MPVSSKLTILFAVALAAVSLPVSGPPAVAPVQAPPPGSWAALQPVRALELGDHGIADPSGLAWSESLGALVVLDSSGRRLTAVTPDEYPVGRVRLPESVAADQIVVGPAAGSVTVLGDQRTIAVDDAAISSGSSAAFGRTDVQVPRGAEGVAHDARGRLVVLDDGALLRPQGSGPARRTTPAAAGHELSGLALHPETGELLTLDTTADRLLALDGRGNVAAVHDASAVEVTDPRALAVGPSGDTTDDPSTLSIYILDAGARGAAGRILETRLQPVGLAASYTVTSSQVRTVQTSAYDPPSPDPSGLAYLPGADRLFITDGEVDEMGIFEGSNFFVTNRAGTVQTRGVSQPWSDEPVGAGYNPVNNHLFVSDDDQKEVFEVVAGADGRFGTSDDTVTHFDTAGFGNTDPEGLDYDPASNSIWLVDGVNAEVFRVQPGGDGRFGTADDVESRFDVGKYGARDPEGLGYDSARDTIVIVDDSSDTIYELDKSGALLNSIDTSAASMTAAAGLAVGPSTSGSGRSYYVVARGQDNDSNPTENDGRLYEISLSLSPVGDVNQPPTVDAGVDQSIVLPSSASLDGTVTDDGLPDPPGALTTTWTMSSGPGAVTFGDAGSVDTTASFATAGTYVLRLTVQDGGTTVVDDVTIQVSPVGGANVAEARVGVGSDDAEQSVSGFTGLTSSDLELTTDGSTQQVVGLRFAGLRVPRGATITGAYVQFRVDEVSTGASSMTIRAEASDSASTYQSLSGNVTSRATTPQSSTWSPPDWTTVGSVGTAQRTPDLSALVQAVVGRSGWVTGNALALQFSGTGRRTAEAYEGGASFAPLLHVEYTTDGGGSGTTNQAPVVDAGSDLAVTLPGAASLNATVTDDGLPDPPAAVTTTWSPVSGPGTVTFGSASSVDTTASFSAAGTYVLRLTADDGALSATDEVTVTVNATGGGATNQAPVVDAGSDLAVTLPGAASLDATVTDDGLPDPPAAVTTTWSPVSGPGRVTFGSASSVDTTASFSAAGTYVLRLTADDGALSVADEITVTVNASGGGTGTSGTVDLRVSAGSDDAEQSVKSGKNALTSDDLEITTDGKTQQLVGIRFVGLQVPQGATITNAYVQFRVDGVSTAATSLAIRAEASDNTPTYTAAVNDVSSRGTTAGSVTWVPPAWTTVGEAGAAQRTPGLQALVQAVVDRPGWASGNALAFQISGTGMRKAVSYEGGASFAPLLHVEYTTDGGGSGTTNQAPVVDAGTSQTIILPSSASLDGTVTDDGLPTPPAAVTTSWTMASGPGPVTFGSVSSVDTTASFSAAGTYVLRLTADDGALSATDDVTVVVNESGGGGTTNQAPVVDAGSDLAVTLPSDASLDATVTDDGLPDPPAAVTTTWSPVSGPGTVTFGSASSVDTTASFSAAGTYVLRLTADDGALSVADEITVRVDAPGGGASQTTEVRISAGSDDAEQSTKFSASTLLSSSDLELTTDGTTVQVIGMRFAALGIPKGATITDAYLQFRTDEVSTGASSLTIRAEDADNTPTYQAVAGNLTSRATTSASVPWAPPDWTAVGDTGLAQRTPNLSALVQAVLNRPGWASGNALAFQISGTGTRKAVSYEGGASFAPLLHVEYTVG